MRILHVTDFHFRQSWFAWLGSHCGEYDAVCFTGDLITLFAGPQRSLADSKPSSLTRLMSPTIVPNVRAQARWVRDWLKAWPAATPLFLCSGNHDWWPHGDDFIDTDADGGWLRKARRPGQIWADGNQSTVIDGHRFLCVPWSHEPKSGSTEPVVALVHAPPAGTDVSSAFGGDAGGDAEVARAARELPRGSVLLCGHVHQPRRWYAQLGTPSGNGVIWAFNPGYGPENATEPNFIVLDTAARQAECHAWGNVLSVSFPIALQQ